MKSQKSKNKSPVNATRRRGFICLSLICALLIQPQNILAADSFAQANPTNSFAQANPADASTQNNTSDPAEDSEGFKEDRKEETRDGDDVTADIAAPVANEGDRDSVPEAGGSDADVTADTADSEDAASVEGIGTQDSVPEDGVSDANDNADASTESNADVNANINANANTKANPESNAAALDVAKTGGDALTGDDVTAGDDELTGGDALTGDDVITGDDAKSDDTDTEKKDDTDTEQTEAAIPVLRSAGDSSPAESKYPSKFDLRDLGRVTPVKAQYPWGTCWAFGATAASETSILTKMGKTYAETGLDLSERYLAWYVAQSITENINPSQAGEGLHLYDENPNNVYLYGGKDKCAGTLYAQGIGPVPESEYPYRGNEGKLAYETLLANKDAYIEAKLTAYKKTNPYDDEDELKSMAEEDYEIELARYAAYDAYSQDDDWTISEPDEPGSGRLRGSPYTLTDNNSFLYWIDENDDGIDEFGKEPISVFYMGLGRIRYLYQDSIDQIKEELTSGRGVSVGLQLNTSSLNTETWAQYYDGHVNAGMHCACIVGWDDDYDASNFKFTPPGNGAWIVKNSWGSETDLIPDGLVAADGTTRDANGGDWGIVDENGLHTGYFYLSYYDYGIEKPESFDFDLRENHDQENALQLDYMPAASGEWVLKSKDPVWCANVFTLDKDMRIDEVATRFSPVNEVPLTGFTVTFDVYRLRDGASAPDDGELLTSCTREFKNCGYHRVALDVPAYCKSGDRLAVVVRQRHNYEDGSAKYFTTAQVSLEYTSNPMFRRDPMYGTPVVNEGESFLKIEGVTEKEEAAEKGWIDVCAPFSRDLLWYMYPDIAQIPAMAEYYESVAIGNPIYDFFGADNFGIKAFGEKVTLEFVKAVEATCEKAGSLEHWRDPLSEALFADELGTKPLTLEDITVNPLGHVWGEPTYTWSRDNSSVTARSICQRENDHVLEETVGTTMTSSASCNKAGKTTWTALFENGIFTEQTRSVDTEPICDGQEEETDSRQSRADDTDVRSGTVKTASAAAAVKTSGSTATCTASAHTGDNADPAQWCMLLAGALACIAALLALDRNRRRTAGSQQPH